MDNRARALAGFRLGGGFGDAIRCDTDGAVALRRSARSLLSLLSLMLMLLLMLPLPLLRRARA